MIIDKYADHLKCIANNSLLPIFSNQKMNAYLKEIAVVCEINKELTFHIARHTLNPTHISLYVALFQFWNCNRFRNPISISRDEVMRISKISSKATYHKCLKNLHALGYLKYEPSYNPYKGSMVYMYNFSENLKPKNKSLNKQVQDKQQTSNLPTTEQAEVSYINNTNSINNNSNSKE